MRVRKVQEYEVPDLPKQLLAARKASNMSLLEICRQLNISATYWYKLEREETGTISYELLCEISKLLSLKLDFDLSQSSKTQAFLGKENGMDLSRLKWIKSVTARDWIHYWAYSPTEIKDSMERTDPKKYIMPQTIYQDGLVIFPLGFKTKGSEKLKSGDLVALTQHSRITHVVEVLDEQSYQTGNWWHRYVKVIWWLPDIDWNDESLYRENIFGVNLNPQQSTPHKISNFKTFKEFWGEDGLTAFQAHVAEQLDRLTQTHISLNSDFRI